MNWTVQELKKVKDLGSTFVKLKKFCLYEHGTGKVIMKWLGWGWMDLGRIKQCYECLVSYMSRLWFATCWLILFFFFFPGRTWWAVVSICQSIQLSKTTQEMILMNTSSLQSVSRSLTHQWIPFSGGPLGSNTFLANFDVTFLSLEETHVKEYT